MYCMRCRHDLPECTCPDIIQRLEAAQAEAKGSLAIQQTITRMKGREALKRDAAKRVN